MIFCGELVACNIHPHLWKINTDFRFVACYKKQYLVSPFQERSFTAVGRATGDIWREGFHFNLFFFLLKENIFWPPCDVMSQPFRCFERLCHRPKRVDNYTPKWKSIIVLVYTKPVNSQWPKKKEFYLAQTSGYHRISQALLTNPERLKIDIHWFGIIQLPWNFPE